MSSSDQPLGPADDPITPVTALARLPDGREVVDVGATASRRKALMVPRLDSSSLRVGDVLTIEYESGHRDALKIVEKRIESLEFGSVTLADPRILATRLEAAEAPTGSEIIFDGSAILPGGGMTTPDTVKVGTYLVTSEGVSTTPVRTFELQRPDQAGALTVVALNARDVANATESFGHARNAFATMRKLLEEHGYEFGAADENGAHTGYERVGNRRLIQAARQGYAPDAVHQDEIYVYDADTQILRGLRNIPSIGVVQALVVRGVDEEIFANATVTYSLNGSGVHRMSRYVPVTTYTWLSPDQETPAVTLAEGGENISERFKTPTRTTLPSFGVSGGEPEYDRFEIDLHPGTFTVRPGSIYLWPSMEQANANMEQISKDVSVARVSGEIEVTVLSHKITAASDPRQEIDQMVEDFKLALDSRGPGIGAKLARAVVRRYPGLANIYRGQGNGSRVSERRASFPSIVR